MTDLAAPPVHPKRLVYIGTPDIAVPPLLALHRAGFEVAAVVSGADMRRSRRGKATPSPVKAAALELGIEVHEDLDGLADLAVDLGVVVAYGKIIPEQILQHLSMVNLHFSKLPRWRGAAPVERALLAGDSETAVCLMGLETGLDTGPIYATEILSIGSSDTAESLKAALSEMGAQLLVDQLKSGLAEPVAQAGEPTYAHKLGKQDFILDWSDSATQLDRVIRVGNARTLFRDKVLKIHAATIAARDDLSPGVLEGQQVGTADKNLELLSVQPEGKASMEAKAWLNGQTLEANEMLGR